LEGEDTGIVFNLALFSSNTSLPVVILVFIKEFNMSFFAYTINENSVVSEGVNNVNVVFVTVVDSWKKVNSAVNMSFMEDWYIDVS
jgi:hypothetical protein